MFMNMLLSLASSASTYTVSIAQFSTLFGYNTDGTNNFGSASGNLTFPKDSSHSVVATYSTSTIDFYIEAQATYAGGATGAFTNVSVINQAGGTVNFLQSAATFLTSPPRWQWGTGSSPVWTATGVNRNVTLT